MMELVLLFFCLSICFNAFFVHHIYTNKLEFVIDGEKEIELNILQVAIEKIHGIERKPTENPEIAYKEAKKIAKVALQDILAHRDNLK